VARTDLAQVNLLELAPVRVASWEEADDGRVVLTRPRPRTRGARRLADLLSYWMSVRRIRLDEVGSFCWRQLDGRCTVGELARRLREAFGEAVEPAEERVGQWVRIMRHQDMLAYPGHDPVPREPASGPPGA